MPQQIVIAEQLRIAAVLTDECVDELIVAQGRYQIGDVYLGRLKMFSRGLMLLSSTLVKAKKMVLFMSPT
jgi:ribonuclease E